jgi:hypothetical protein
MLFFYFMLKYGFYAEIKIQPIRIKTLKVFHTYIGTHTHTQSFIFFIFA